MGRCYLKELEYNDCVYIMEDKIIIFDFEDPIDTKACENEAIEDLIQANLVDELDYK